jgi:cell division protein FtsQ
MSEKKRYSVRKILLAILWLTVGAGTTVLLVSAIKKKDATKCKGVAIKISGIENKDSEKFVDAEDVFNTIQKFNNGDPEGKSIGSFDLKRVEIELEKSRWVKNAELFFDNFDSLRVNLQEREPVARVFTSTNGSFYIDTALAILPLSDKFSARLPVFTGFPTDNIVLSAADSSLLRDISDISIAIQKDPFRMGMIEQVDITPQRDFEMIPKIGNQLIVFGDASAAEEKFNKLELFYKQVIIKTGWDKYSVINVQYKNQLVAKRRGAEDKTADSVRTLQIMQLIAASAAKQAEDSLQTIVPDNNNNTADSSMIQQSIQREDNFETSNQATGGSLQPITQTPNLNPVHANPLPPVKQTPSNSIPAKKPEPAHSVKGTKSSPVTKNDKAAPIKKPNAVVPVVKQNVQPATQKPKIVMPKKTDKRVKNEY